MSGGHAVSGQVVTSDHSSVKVSFSFDVRVNGVFWAGEGCDPIYHL